jgi:hypothetical protein
VASQAELVSRIRRHASRIAADDLLSELGAGNSVSWNTGGMGTLFKMDWLLCAKMCGESTACVEPS